MAFLLCAFWTKSSPSCCSLSPAPLPLLLDGHSLCGLLWYKIRMNCHSPLPGEKLIQIEVLSLHTCSSSKLWANPDHSVLGEAQAHCLKLGLCLLCSPQSMMVYSTIRHTINALNESTCHAVFLALYLLISTASQDLLSSRTLFQTWDAEAATPLYLRQSPLKSGVGGNMDLINFRHSFIWTLTPQGKVIWFLN